MGLKLNRMGEEHRKRITLLPRAHGPHVVLLTEVIKTKH